MLALCSPVVQKLGQDGDDQVGSVQELRLGWPLWKQRPLVEQMWVAGQQNVGAFSGSTSVDGSWQGRSTRAAEPFGW